jgi:hypothetical protein
VALFAQMPDRTEIGGSLELTPLPAIQQKIMVVRERHVMLDEDLAELYGVQTRRLIEQVKRNTDRFPSDFMFQLTKDEALALRSQSATSKDGRGGRRYAPYVFTEQGVAMLTRPLFWLAHHTLTRAWRPRAHTLGLPPSRRADAHQKPAPLLTSAQTPCDR